MSLAGRVFWMLFAWFPVLLFTAGRFNPEETRNTFGDEWRLYTATMKQAFPRR